jgi:hypothetical protein
MEGIEGVEQIASETAYTVLVERTATCVPHLFEKRNSTAGVRITSIDIQRPTWNRCSCT